MKLYDVNNVALYCNLTPKRIKQLTAEGHLTEEQKGYYNISTAARQYIMYLQKQNADKDLTSDYNTERAKLVKTKRENEEIELEYKRGQYHKSEEVEFVIKNMLIAFRSKCMTLPNTILNEISGETNEGVILDKIRKEVTSRLDELKDYNMLFKSDQ